MRSMYLGWVERMVVWCGVVWCGVVPQDDTVLRHSLTMRSMYLDWVERMVVWCGASS
jgi:hypothetical protein